MKIKNYLNTTKIKWKYKKKFNDSKRLHNEAFIYKILNIDFKIRGKKIIRKIFEGKTIKSWNTDKKNSLINAIENFHKLPKHNAPIFNWKLYNHFSYVLSDSQFKKFNSLIDKIDKELVLSHNDINNNNLLWNGDYIKLIDFEWASLNHPYFDYVNFYIHEDIILKDNFDQKEWNNVLFLTLCYFLMWSEKHKNVSYIQGLKVKYTKMLNSI